MSQTTRIRPSSSRARALGVLLVLALYAVVIGLGAQPLAGLFTLELLGDSRSAPELAALLVPVFAPPAAALWLGKFRRAASTPHWWLVWLVTVALVGALAFEVLTLDSLMRADFGPT